MKNKFFNPDNSVFFLFALPVFFVLNGLTENYPFIPLFDILILAIYYLTTALLILLAYYLLFRNWIKSAVAAFYTMVIFLFFGYFHDMIKQITGSGFFSRYAVLLTTVLITTVSMIVYLYRKKSIEKKSIRFLNLLLLAFLCYDAVRLIVIYSRQENTVEKREYSLKAIPGLELPDIYYIVPDEYSSSSTLKKLWGFPNQQMDSFLIGKGFHLLSNSSSNYNFTPFSIASTLNMQYLDWIPDKNSCTPEDYNRCAVMIKENAVVADLRNIGYDVINHSVFDLKGLPSVTDETLLPLKTKLITQQTLLSRIRKDLGHLLFAGQFEISWLTKEMIYDVGVQNEKIFTLTDSMAKVRSGKPRFVYTHLYLPHPPFYFDENGKSRDKSVLISEKDTNPAEAYVHYIPYANRKLQELIAKILDNKSRKSVIVLLSDHGFRGAHERVPIEYHFKNYAAVYLPDSNYDKFHDSLTNINIFPVLFNSIFKANIPLRQDTSFILKDRIQQFN